MGWNAWGWNAWGWKSWGRKSGGWKSGALGLGLAFAAGAGPCAEAAEPGASFGAFEGRDYLLVWPAAPPQGLLVYFHADASGEPFAEEADSGMLEALAYDGAQRGYAVLAPATAEGGCATAAARACWRVADVADELGYVDRLVGFVERANATQLPVRDALGYRAGADLLIAGLAARRLDGYRKLGLLDAGAPAGPLPLGGEAATGPLVYLEAPEGDPAAAGRAAALLSALVSAGYGRNTCAQGDAGGEDYDYRRLLAFLAWFAEDCRLENAPAGEAGPAQPGRPDADEAEQSDEPRERRGLFGIFRQPRRD